MKIAIGLFHYFPQGGLTRDMNVIAGLLAERGHEVSVFCFRSSSNDIPNNLNMTVLPVKGFSNAKKVSAFVEAFYAQAQVKEADLIVGFNKMPGLDVYYAADGCIKHKYQNRLSRFSKRVRVYSQYEEAVFGESSSTLVLAISEPQLEIYKELYRLPDERYILLPPGIDQTRVWSAEIEEKRSAKRREVLDVETDKLILFIGSGFKTKGMDRAIRLLERINQREKSTFIVAGQDKADSYVKLARSLGIEKKVKFLGARKDIPELIQAADILLHPAYWENTGTVLLEAMLGALPVVTTSACGYARYIEQEEFGLVYQGDDMLDESSLASIQELMAKGRHYFVQKAQKLAKDHYWFSQHDNAVLAIERAYAEA